MKDLDFDAHFNRVERHVSIQMWIIAITRLVWAVGCIGILVGFVWLMGHLAGAW